MNYRNGFLATVAVLGLSGAALPAFAYPGKGEFAMQGGAGGCMMGGHGHVMSMLEGLDLTKPQRKKIDAILSDAHDQDHADDMRGEFSRVHQQIQDILMSPGPVDKDRIAALQQQQAALRAQVEARHLDVAYRIHDVLTPEQLAQVKARQIRIHELMDQLREAEHPEPPPSDK